MSQSQSGANLKGGAMEATIGAGPVTAGEMREVRGLLAEWRMESD